MAGDPLVRKKLEQAVALMREQGVDLWIAQLAQETWNHPDPLQSIVIGTSVVWPGAFLVAAAGATIALVAKGDVVYVERTGAYQRVEGYFTDLEPELRRVLEELEPRSIAVSYALSDHGADGITHGWFLK